MELKPLKIGELEVKRPIIQGGMGVGVSLSSLAGTVANEGGIGIISTAQIGFREEDFAKDSMAANLRAIGKEFKKARDISPDGVIGFNIMVATRNYADYVKEAVKAKANVIISGAGLPITLPELVRGSDTKIAPIVSTEKSALVICKMWDRKYQTAPDFVVIEGPMAGGHLGFTQEQLENFDKDSYEAEIIKIIAVVKEYGRKYEREIPVIIAGGIYSYEDVLRQFELGANGVQVATRFVTTKECDAPDDYKNTYINTKKEDIVITKSPVGMPGRAISNPFLKKIGVERSEITKCYRCLDKCDIKTIPYCITSALVNAVTGKTEEALIFCGANAYRATKIETVKEVLDDLCGVGH